MNANQFTRRLRRELVANPKKAAILGLLALVALYSWAPLVWGWVGSNNSKSKSSDNLAADDLGASIFGDGPQLSSASPKPDQPKVFPWKQLALWMEHDPKTAAATLADRRDPFHDAQSVVAKTAQQEQQESKQAVITPDNLGIRVSSTVVGPRRRTALINGKPYEEGDTVTIAGNEEPTVFTLAHVAPRHVVLQRQDKQFTVAIPTPERSGRIELVVAGE